MVVISMMHAQARIAFGEAEMCCPESRTGFAVFLFLFALFQSVGFSSGLCVHNYFLPQYFLHSALFNFIQSQTTDGIGCNIAKLSFGLEVAKKQGNPQVEIRNLCDKIAE